MTEPVIAAHVRKIDPPQFVAEDLDELFERVGEEWSGEQCDNCGNSLYVIRYDRKFDRDQVRKLRSPLAFYMECVPDADFWEQNGQEIPEGVGCHTEYRLAWYGENEVTW